MLLWRLLQQQPTRYCCGFGYCCRRRRRFRWLRWQQQQHSYYHWTLLRSNSHSNNNNRNILQRQQQRSPVFVSTRNSNIQQQQSSGSSTMESTTGTTSSLPEEQGTAVGTSNDASNNDPDNTKKQQQQQQKSRLVVILAGPTAVGKSAVAASICSDTKGVIVSADSVQAYSAVQIGANKPSFEELRRTPHVLLSVVTDPAENYSAAAWRDDALYAIQCLLNPTTTAIDGDDEQQDGDDAQYSSAATTGGQQDHDHDDHDHHDEQEQQKKQQQQHRSAAVLSAVQDAKRLKGYDAHEPVTPVIVGGTMMYLQWLVHGRPDAAKPSPAVVQKAADDISRYYQQRQHHHNKVKQQHDDEEDCDGGDDNDNDDDDGGDWDGAVQYVASFGEVFSQQIDKLSGKDWYRLRRILEVAYSVQEKKKKEDEGTCNNEHDNNEHDNNNMTTATTTSTYSGIREGSLSSYGYDVRCFFLCPDDRMEHAKVMDRRCEEMICAGLLQETTDLILSEQLPDMAARAIGYRQTIEYLNREMKKKKNAAGAAGGGGAAAAGATAAAAAAVEQHDDDTGITTAAEEEASFVHYLEQFTTATRRYARKQMQWFRKDHSFLFVPVDMSKNSHDRVQLAADDMKRLMELPRDDYDDVLLSSSSSCCSKNNSSSDTSPTSDSTTIRRINQEQGKMMKTYQFQPQILTSGSVQLDDAVRRADDCVKRLLLQETKTTTN